MIEDYISKPRKELGKFELGRSQSWPIEKWADGLVINKSLSNYRAQNVFRIGEQLVLIRLNRGDQDTQRPFDDYVQDGEVKNRFRLSAMKAFTGSEVFCKVAAETKDPSFIKLVKDLDSKKIRTVKE